MLTLWLQSKSKGHCTEAHEIQTWRIGDDIYLYIVDCRGTMLSEIHKFWNISPPDVWCLQCVWCVPNQSNSIRTHCLGRPPVHVTRPGNRSWRTMVLRRSCDDTRPWGHLNSWRSTFQLVSVSCLLTAHLLHLYFSFRVWSRSQAILWDRAVELQTKAKGPSEGS